MEQEKKVIQVTSMFGANTRKPLVRVELDDTAVIISPSEARNLGLNLLMAAEAALSDAFLHSFVMRLTDGDEAAATVLMSEFRDWRLGHDSEVAGGHDEPADKES